MVLFFRGTFEAMSRSDFGDVISWFKVEIGIMPVIGACRSRPSRRSVPACVLCLAAFGLAGCSSGVDAKENLALIPSSREFVLPGGEARAAQLMAGLAQPGSDFGPFSGRNDGKIGLNPSGGEKFEDQYDRRILDRQFSSLGRPFNIYQDTTRSISRVSR